MITLTLQDKKTLMEMLRKHYSINESAFIKAIAQNEEEEVELTLKAFSLKGKSKVAVQQIKEEDEKPDFKIVQIDHLNNHLYLVKAIKEVCNVGLAQAKDMTDFIRSHFSDGTSIWNPFKVGDTSDCKFSFEHWSSIVTQVLILADEHNTTFKWHYV